MSHNFQQFFRQNIQPLNSQAIKMNYEQPSMFNKVYQQQQGMLQKNNNSTNLSINIPPQLATSQITPNSKQNQQEKESFTVKFNNQSHISSNYTETSTNQLIVTPKKNQSMMAQKIAVPNQINSQTFNSFYNVPVVVKTMQFAQQPKSPTIQICQRSRSGSIVQIVQNQHYRSNSGSKNIVLNPPQLIQTQVITNSPQIVRIQQLQNNNSQTLYSSLTNQQQINSQTFISQNPQPIQQSQKQFGLQNLVFENSRVQNNDENLFIISQDNSLQSSMITSNLDQKQHSPVQLNQVKNQKLNINSQLSSQQTISDQQLRNSNSEVQLAHNEETMRLRNEIEYLQNKLFLKEEEVNIFQQYLNDCKESEKEKSLLFQQLEEAKAQTQFLQHQQSKQFSNGVNDKETNDLKQKIFLQQEEMVILNKELQNALKSNQSSENHLHNLDKNNQELKKQLEEKNQIVRKQKEEIIILQSRQNNTLQEQNGDESISQKRIIELEQQNQLYILKIQSLERNLVTFEKENKKLKEEQIAQKLQNLQFD